VVKHLHSVVIDDSSRSNMSVFAFLACGMNECRRESWVYCLCVPTVQKGKNDGTAHFNKSPVLHDVSFIALIYV